MNYSEIHLTICYGRGINGMQENVIVTDNLNLSNLSEPFVNVCGWHLKEVNTDKRPYPLLYGRKRNFLISVDKIAFICESNDYFEREE